MEVSHPPTDKRTARDVWTALQDLPQRVSSLLKKYASSNPGGFEDFERELHALFAHTECAVTEEALAHHDVDLPFVFIDGEMHRRACRCAQTYLTAAGPVSVTRTLYRARRGERAVAALERRVGIVEGYWTPLAARQGAMLVSHLTPRDAEEVLATLGQMQPSKSSLDRLPKALSTRWEAQREHFETTVREATVEVPDAARAVVVSLDGVMAPMRGAGKYREAAGRVYHLVDIQIPDPKQPVTPETFTFSLRRDKLRTVRQREGRYLLRSNLRHEDPATLWQYYIRLTEIEQAFKELKHDLARAHRLARSGPVQHHGLDSGYSAHGLGGCMPVFAHRVRVGIGAVVAGDSSSRTTHVLQHRTVYLLLTIALIGLIGRASMISDVRHCFIS